jgi:hypothetical protein
MSLLVALVAAAIQLRPDAPSLTLVQARSLAPSALADLLLAPGHPEVVEAVVGSENMQPPPPPGYGAVTFYTRARPSPRPDFCERIVAYVDLKANAAGAAAPSFTADRMTWRTAYRWMGRSRGAHACEGPRSDFFSPEPSETDRALAVIRLLAAAGARAEDSRALPFEVSIDDREGPKMQAFARANGIAGARGLETITDARAALARLPIDKVLMVERPDRGRRDLLTASDLADIDSHRLQAETVFLGYDWTATLLLAGDRIVRLRLRREMPPPF